MIQPSKAIIIGAGVAGPVIALYLQRAGINAEIFEARGDDSTGYFLNLAGNGVEILKTAGIEKPIIAKGSPVPRMVMWSGKSGKHLGEVRNGARAGLTESVLIRRGALQDCLRDAAVKQGIPIHFDKKLREIQTTAQGVTAHFEDGTTAQGDFLIGCDGVHSRTRQIINPDAPKPRYTGLVSTGGFTSNLDLPPTPQTQHFIFGQRAFFGYHVRASGEIYWFNNHGQAQEPDRNELTQIVSDDWQRRLLDMHRDDMPLINRIMQATDDGIGAYPIYDIPPQPVWHKGRVVLAGDAVHAISPSSGQGASLAMEDAAVLAKCLREIPDLEAAFSAYENSRRERVEKMVKWGRTLGGAKMATSPIQVWFRDLLMPFFLKFAANPTSLDWVYDYKIA